MRRILPSFLKIVPWTRKIHHSNACLYYYFGKHGVFFTFTLRFHSWYRIKYTSTAREALHWNFSKFDKIIWIVPPNRSENLLPVKILVLVYLSWSLMIFSDELAVKSQRQKHSFTRSTATVGRSSRVQFERKSHLHMQIRPLASRLRGRNWKENNTFVPWGRYV